MNSLIVPAAPHIVLPIYTPTVQAARLLVYRHEYLQIARSVVAYQLCDSGDDTVANAQDSGFLSPALDLHPSAEDEIVECMSFLRSITNILTGL